MKIYREDINRIKFLDFSNEERSKNDLRRVI